MELLSDILAIDLLVYFLACRKKYQRILQVLFSPETSSGFQIALGHVSQYETWNEVLHT